MVSAPEQTRQVRCAYRNEWQAAMDLAWRTFVLFEAGTYPPEGVRNFRNFISDEVLYRMFRTGAYQLFVATDGGQIIGMATLRYVYHMSLLFGDTDYHRQRVGRALGQYLQDYLLREVGAARMTVDAAPYGVEFYHKLGFRDKGPEEEKAGIVYTPMELVL